jgi:hypothetical protein
MITATTAELAICGNGASPFTGNGHDVTAELQRESLRHADHPSSDDKASQARSQLNSGHSLEL